MDYVKEFQKILDELSGVHYGMYNMKFQKVLYSETEPDEINLFDYLQQHGDSDFKILKPNEVIKLKAGTCWDTSLYIYKRIKDLGLNPQIVFFVIGRDNAGPITHTTVVVETSEGLYNVEYSDSTKRGVHEIQSTKDVIKGWPEENLAYFNPNIDVDKILSIANISPQQFIQLTGWKDAYQEKGESTMANTISIGNENGGGQAGINMTRNSSMGWSSWDEKSSRNHIINTLIRVKPENAEELLREAFLIVPSALSDNIKFNIIGEDKWEDLHNGDYRYPHHEIEDDEHMIVKLRGLDACWYRLKRAGKLSGDPKEHLERHYKEFGATTPDKVEDKITENFDHIESLLENTKTTNHTFDLKQLPETFQKLVEETTDLIIETMNVMVKRPKFEFLNKAAVLREIQKAFRGEWRKTVIVKTDSTGKFKESWITITGAKQHWNFFDAIKSPQGPEYVYKTFFALMEAIDKEINNKINDTSKSWGLEFVLGGDPIDQIHSFEFKLTPGVAEFLWKHIHKEDFIRESFEHFFEGKILDSIIGFFKRIPKEVAGFMDNSTWWQKERYIEEPPDGEDVNIIPTIDLPESSEKATLEALKNLSKKYNANIVFVPRWSLRMRSMISERGGVAFLAVEKGKLDELFKGKISAMPNEFLTAKYDKVIIINTFKFLKHRNVKTVADLKIALDHEYGHYMTYEQNTKRDLMEYAFKCSIIFALVSELFSEQRVADYNAIYQHLKMERLSNEYSNIDFNSMVYLLCGKRPSSNWRNLKAYKLIDMDIPMEILEIQNKINTGSITPIEGYTFSKYFNNLHQSFKESSLMFENSSYTFDIINESLRELEPDRFMKEAKVMNQYCEDADDFNPEDYWIEEVGGPPPGFEDDPSPQPAPAKPEPKPVPHQKQPSLTSQRHAEESDKNGVRRKQLYIAFIEYAKAYNPKNTFGSLFQKDTFRVTYPFIPDEMRYFYRLANPLLCVLGGDLTFFSVEKLRDVNKGNAEKDKYLIFAATPNDLRIFNKEDKMIYRATKVKEQPGVQTPIELKENLGPDFDNYLQKMVGQGDILNSPLPEDTPKTEAVVMEKSEGRSLTPVERKIVEDRFGSSAKGASFKFVPDKGYYAYTHRSRTDFYEDLYQMPKGKVAFVASTS